MGVLADQLSADRNFDRLYRRHVGDVYRYAAALLANPSDAEDVTQTTFLNAYRAMSGGEHPQKPGKHRGLQKTGHYKPLTKHSTRHGSVRHLLR